MNTGDEKIGAVMVVGAGVSGIQAALDTAKAGFKVYLVDKGPAIGGKMAQLDKTFPTNDCSMCILSPKFIECATDPNVEIITDAEVERLEGEAGDFRVTLFQKPRYVDPEKCTGCGTCAEYCPVHVPDAYNEDLSTLKCIHLPFPQAVPAVSLVDPERCLFLERRICQICVHACRNKAIDFHQRERRREIRVGSLILAPGYEAFSPRVQSQYGYGRFRNVVTSLEYERMLSASGPNRGELRRPSDGRHPKRIAWIQCVGSRDKTAGNPYCSSVCCMYAIKQVLLSKEHDPELEAHVLHNDIRAYGKGFERYYDRARNTPGVRFTWSKVSVLGEDRETGTVRLRYRLNGTGLKDEDFDLVVLSVGLLSPETNRHLASRLGITVNEYGFCEGSPSSPMETSRPGIYHCGVFHAPMDIPDSVTMASGAASLVSQLLNDRRGTLVEKKEYPVERDVRGEPPRVGVFVCDCGTNIVKTVDVKKVVEYSRGLMGVVHAEENTFSCSIDSVTHMANVIREKGLNRLVVAACTPRTHERVFQDALRDAGLNPFLFEFANIREQCSLVHMREKGSATDKAKDLVRMAVARATLLEPLYQVSYRVNRSALVIGGGLSGMVAALGLAEQGIPVHVVEKGEELGGTARRIHYTIEGTDIQAYLRDLIKKVYKSLLIQVHTESRVVDFSGYVGNFVSRIAVGKRGLLKEIPHGVTIVATGTEEFKPAVYGYGEDPRVVTQLELEGEIQAGGERLKQCGTMVMIQCVGSREEERPYCSRVCCSHAVKNALRLKDIHPSMDIYVLYRDMRTYAFREDYYRRAAEKGVTFIRYESDDKPEVAAIQEEGRPVLKVAVTEPTLGGRLLIDADMVALAAAAIPPQENRSLSRLLKVPLNEDGFFMEAHMKLRPVEFATDGIFMCGTAHSPKFIDESIAQAQAAASRALTVLAQEEWKAGGPVCRVTARRCSGCGLCVQVCPYQAVTLGEEGFAVVNQALCKGCGVCVASCRSGALDLGGVSDQQTWSLIQAL
ncbi:MAG: CoB--CoM heterodisulfide reductase iron-sulfur subunit A family protein [Deltaproteobacteria bacterium]|nr:CoB--CoM heterodisulfide reductase iron-sulfur subunit A family protein [Deltaproteobacteria bacterium]